jgi:3-oxoacyl-[acyl-carrier protein] reductase
MNRDFGRRSPFRKNVVHGMLAVLFISALDFRAGKGLFPYLTKITTKFLKPIFVNDPLSLEAKALEAEDGASDLRFEYRLHHRETGVLLTIGNFALEMRPDHGSGTPLPHPESPEAMTLRKLSESAWNIDHIQEGEEGAIPFLVAENHLRWYHRILNDGVEDAKALEYADWTKNFDCVGLLANSLLSPFVGMCIPGKFATFLDFVTQFRGPVESGKTYALKGRVAFKSSSASTIGLDLVAAAEAEGEEPCFTSRATVRINQPPVKMPSIGSLKTEALDLDLAGRVALITGGSRGIGETIAKLLALHGARVAINYLHGRDEAQRIAHEIAEHGAQAITVQGDVADQAQVRGFVQRVQEEYGTIDILVNNAVSDFSGTDFENLRWEDVQKDLDVIVKGAFLCCQEVIPLMTAQGRGKIINLGTLATDVPPPGQSKYVIAKSALVGLTRSLAVEYAAHNIQVNLVEPSIVETDLTSHIPRLVMAGLANDSPLKRNATPIDVAKAVLFLASSMCSFTTGQKIMVTGGNPPFL